MKSKHTSMICVLLSSSALLMGQTNKPDTTIEEMAKNSIKKGVEWLCAHQATNGVWSNPTFPALTAMPMWALSATDADKSHIEKAAAFIRSCAQPDGGIYVVVPNRRGGALGTYNTAICMTALHYADKGASIRTIQKAREYVAATQLSGDDGDDNTGGFGYEKNSPNGYVDMNNSAWAISAMRITQDVEENRPSGEKKVDINWDDARKFIEKMQVKPDDETASREDAGGFLYKRENGTPPAPPQGGTTGKTEKTQQMAKRPPLRSYGSITYSGLEAMIFAQMSKNDPRVLSAFDYAHRHWTVDENPGMGLQGLYYYYTIMARALSLLQMDTLPPFVERQMPIRWKDELIQKIVSLQREDGSWVNTNNRFWEGDPVLSTSYAILAMEYALGYFK